MAILDGRTVLVLGGTGEVGEGIVRGLLAQGATVAVPSRAEERLASLRDRLGAPKQLITAVGDVGRPQGAASLVQRLEADCPPLDAAVASLGGSWQGPRLVDLSIEMWETFLRGTLTAHFLAARAFLPLVRRRQGTYVFVNHGASQAPVEGAGPLSVSAAAQVMLMRTFAAEEAAGGARVLSVVLSKPVVTRTEPEGPADAPTAEGVGGAVASLLANGAEHRSGAVIPL
jgi:NAD(P)-dependent dehydrogenase (short-subunit alcohol dehydrogenase family)